MDRTEIVIWAAVFSCLCILLVGRATQAQDIVGYTQGSVPVDIVVTEQSYDEAFWEFYVAVFPDEAGDFWVFGPHAEAYYRARAVGFPQGQLLERLESEPSNVIYLSEPPESLMLAVGLLALSVFVSNFAR